MIRRYLDNYSNFKCIADKCPDNCCRNWLIEIDDVSYERYLYHDGKLSDFIRRNVNRNEHCFREGPSGDCAFLLPDGLCLMQKELGEAFLCDTCRTYPRHTEEFPGIREYSISISCPAEAKRLLLKKDTLIITELSDGEQDNEDYDNFDNDLYDILLSCRSRLLPVLRDRSLSFAERTDIVIGFMHGVQELIDDGSFDECHGYIDTFPALIPAPIERNRYALLRAAFSLQYELEELNPGFRSFVRKADNILFGQGAEAFASLQEEFDSSTADIDICLEQISVYFLYTYLCGAAYDGYVFAMAAQALYNAHMIRLLFMAAWYTDGKVLSTDRMVEIVYSYSRELEHSTENQILLEQLLDEFGY